MKKSRAHYYKLFFLSSLSLFLLFSSSCGNKKTTKFCEGVTLKGEGVKCGDTFTTGDITTLIKIDTDISAETVSVKVFSDDTSTDKFLFSNTVKIDKNKNYILHNIRLENPGKYHIRTMDSKKLLSEGTVEVVQ